MPLVLLFSSGRRQQARSMMIGTAVAAAVLGVGAVRVRAGVDSLSAPMGTVTGTATAMTDPERTTRGDAQVVLRINGHRYLATATGQTAQALRRLRAGERITIEGTIRRRPLRGWRIARHLSGDLALQRVGFPRRGSALSTLANGIRTELLASAQVLESRDRALFAGFVLGDDRGQSVLTTDEFRGSGLSHLLVVSGQNVAFVLAVLEPGLRRLRRRGRFMAVLVVLIIFTSVTRFEPSVLRAGAMAALASWSVFLGRPQNALRVLAIATSALLVFDPLLAWSLGLLLSIAACGGLAVGAVPLERAMRARGVPAFLAKPGSAIVAAQAGASLVMIPTFGSVPVVAVVANLFVLPAAGPIMAWGVAAGLPAGIARRWFGSGPSTIVHVPTTFALRWVASVASTSSALPLGEFRGRDVLVGICVGGGVGVAVGLLRTLRRRSGPAGPRKGATACLCVAVALASSLSRAPSSVHLNGVDVIGISGRFERRADLLVIRHGVRVDELLARLRGERIGAVDLVLVASGGRPQGAVVDAISARVDVGAVVGSSRTSAGHARPFLPAVAGLRLLAGHTSVLIRAVVGSKVDFDTLQPALVREDRRASAPK